MANLVLEYMHEIHRDGLKREDSGGGLMSNKEEKLVVKVEKSLSEVNKTFPVSIKKKLNAALNSIVEDKTLSVFSDLLQGQEIGKDALSVIKKETVYIAKIPKKLESGLDKGIFDFMKDSKTGESIGVIVGDKNRTHGIVRVEEMDKAAVAGGNISANIANLAMQQKLAHITEVLDDVQSRVIAIQEGQDAELFGKIKGMREQLLQMKDIENTETRRQLGTNVITVLNSTRGSIEEKMKLELRNLPDVPDSAVKIVWEITKDKKYLTTVVDTYNHIEELFKYYMVASLLLGYAYSMLDESGPFDIIFVPDQELIENEKLKTLVAAENIFEESFKETWYKNPEKFLLKVKEEAQRLFEEQDYIQLEITGEQLLEVIGYGGEEINEDDKN